MVGGAVSWDVLVFHAPAKCCRGRQDQGDFHPSALGSGAEVRQRLYERLPKLDLSDPTWACCRPHMDIEVNIGSEDLVTSIMLHLRGGGNDVRWSSRRSPMHSAHWRWTCPPENS